MFQVVVRFVAVNGTVSTDRVVVTLVDKNGKPAKDGVGHLTKNQIAAATEPTTPPARPTRKLVQQRRQVMQLSRMPLHQVRRR